jgi:hypothetical protein
MTLTRRVSTLEADGDATERVVRWLAEAHAYDDFDTYVAATFPDDDLPMDRLSRETVAAIRGRKGPRSRDVEAEVAEALRAVVFRIHLALRILETTQEALDREVLLHGYLSLLLVVQMDNDPEHRGAFGTVDGIRDVLVDRVGHMLALQEAREQAEARYLGGQTALFPNMQRDWAAQLQRSKSSAMHAVRAAELDGLPHIDPDAGVPTEAAVERFFGDLVEVARIKALDTVGDGWAAHKRMRAWLEPRLR